MRGGAAAGCQLTMSKGAVTDSARNCTAWKLTKVRKLHLDRAGTALTKPERFNTVEEQWCGRQ